jgi:hypothetical protein
MIMMMNDAPVLFRTILQEAEELFGMLIAKM